jgi:hypothetical protein
VEVTGTEQVLVDWPLAMDRLDWVGLASLT